MLHSTYSSLEGYLPRDEGGDSRRHCHQRPVSTRWKGGKGRGDMGREHRYRIERTTMGPEQEETVTVC